MRKDSNNNNNRHARILHLDDLSTCRSRTRRAYTPSWRATSATSTSTISGAVHEQHMLRIDVSMFRCIGRCWWCLFCLLDPNKRVYFSPSLLFLRCSLKQPNPQTTLVMLCDSLSSLDTSPGPSMRAWRTQHRLRVAAALFLILGIYQRKSNAAAADIFFIFHNRHAPPPPRTVHAPPPLPSSCLLLLSYSPSWTGDYQAYNLCTPSAFPGVSRKIRAAQFGRVVYYPPEDAEKGDARPTPTRMRGIPLVSLPKVSGGGGGGVVFCLSGTVPCVPRKSPKGWRRVTLDPFRSREGRSEYGETECRRRDRVAPSMSTDKPRTRRPVRTLPRKRALVFGRTVPGVNSGARLVFVDTDRRRMGRHVDREYSHLAGSTFTARSLGSTSLLIINIHVHPSFCGRTRRITGQPKNSGERLRLAETASEVRRYGGTAAAAAAEGVQLRPPAR